MSMVITADDLILLRTRRIEISHLEQQIAALRSEAERVTSEMRGMPTGTAHDRMADQISRLVDLQMQRTDAMIAREDLILLAEEWISSLPEQQRKVMHTRYVLGKKWEDVARITHYSVGHCTKIHSAAIGKLR